MNRLKVESAQGEVVQFYTNHRSSNTMTSSHLFAEFNATEIANAAADMSGGELCIRAYMPPYDKKTPHGYVELAMAKGGVRCGVGIVFGWEEAKGVFTRCDFVPHAWLEDRDDPFSGALCAASFDEAWRIVCLAAQLLKPTSLTIAYGV